MSMTPQERIGFIGGSDAAAACGISKYKTPIQLWLEKTGQRQPESLKNNLRVELGADMEDWVARKFAAEQGLTLRRQRRTFQLDGHDWFRGHIDRKVSGARVGVEIKVSQDAPAWRNEVYPKDYYMQCLHYLIASGYERWFLVALVLDQAQTRIVHYEIAASRALRAKLVAREQEFWDHVCDLTAPRPLTAEDIARLYPEDKPDKTAYANKGTVAQVSELRGVKAEIKAMKGQQAALEMAIKAEIQDAGELKDPMGDAILATWHKSKDSVSIDWEKTARQLWRGDLVEPDQTIEHYAHAQGFSTKKPGSRTFIVKKPRLQKEKPAQRIGRR